MERRLLISDVSAQLFSPTFRDQGVKLLEHLMLDYGLSRNVRYWLIIYARSVLEERRSHVTNVTQARIKRTCSNGRRKEKYTQNFSRNSKGKTLFTEDKVWWYVLDSSEAYGLQRHYTV